MKEGYLKVIASINRQNSEGDYAELLEYNGTYAIECRAGTTVTMHMLSAGNGYGIHSDSTVIDVYKDGRIGITFTYGDEEL